MTRECTTEFPTDYIYKYWTLYDISCSIVAAYIQYRALIAQPATSEDEEYPDENTEELLGTLSAKIAHLVVAEALRLHRMHGVNEGYTVLLMDIIEVLHPVLADHPDQQCREGYETILVMRNHFRISLPYQIG